MKHKLLTLIVGFGMAGLIAISAGLTPAIANPQSPDEVIATQLAKLTASDGLGTDFFGVSTAIDGDITVIGAFNADISGKSNQGAAYVFYRNQGGMEAWGQKAKLSAADGTAEDFFGRSVSISEDRIAIGAYQADVGGNADQGAVYLFERNTGGTDAWGQARKITTTDGSTGDWFGLYVTLAGDTLVVAATGADVGGNADQGVVYIYYRNLGGENNWGQAARLTASDGGAGDLLGWPVRIDGEVLVAGASGKNNLQGAAYIFYRNQDGSDAWGEVKKLVASDGQSEDRFGFSVGVSGDIVMAGAYQADPGGNTDQGAVYVYQRDTGGADQWGLVKKLLASGGAADSRFGESLAIYENRAVVGAYTASPGGIYRAGEAYVYLRNHGGDNAWGEAAVLTASDANPDDQFGYSVSLDENLVSIGAYATDFGSATNQGAAYVFSLKELPFRVYCPWVAKPCVPLYSDTFSNPGSGWLVADNDNYRTEYRNGEYRMLVRSTGWGVYSYPGFQASDYSVSVDVRNAFGVFGSYGILFGMAADASTAYSLEIFPDGYYGLYRWDPDSYTTIAEAFSPAISQGRAANQIKVVRNGSSIKAYANGQLLIGYEENTYTGSRYIGLIVFSYEEPEVDIYFDNFLVMPINCANSSSASIAAGGWQQAGSQQLLNRMQKGHSNHR